MSNLNGKTVVVIDDDPLILKMSEGHFATRGTQAVHKFEEAGPAWSFLKDNEADCFVLDWQLSRETSTGIFSRIRAHRDFQLSPVIVICGKMSAADRSLIDEFPATSFLQKPFSAALITNMMERLILEENQYKQHQKLIDSFMEVSETNEDAALESYQKVKKKIGESIAFDILAARTFRHAHFFEAALSILEDIHKEQPDHLPTLTEIAKVYNAMGKHRVCLKFLRSAIELSPNHFERLMLAGSSHLHEHETDEAKKFFDQALEVDSSSQEARRAIQTCDNMDDYFRKHGRKGVPGNLASLLNIIAVNLVRNNQVIDALEQYQSAFDFAQDNEDKARVAFNIGLGHMRGKDHGQANQWFNKSLEIHPVCKVKATAMIERMNGGNTVTLNSVEDEGNEDEILGGFLQPEKKNQEDSPAESSDANAQKEESTEEYDDFLDDFDVDLD